EMGGQNIWEFTDYRAYINALVGPKGTRSGRRKQMAAAIGVHTTLVSQMLAERVDFSLEQAEALNRHLGHTDEESDYFLTMVMKARSGTAQLRERFRRKLDVQQEARQKIKERLKPEATIAPEDRERFYSSYIYGAIHVLTSI